MAAGRRANREGSFTQRGDGLWMGRVQLSDGSRHTYYGRTREEAGDKLADAVKQDRSGVPVPSKALRLDAYLKDWLAGIKNTLRPTTHETYERHLRLHVTPYLGRHTLTRLGPGDVQRMEHQLIAGGLSPTTVRHCHWILHKALDQAVRWGLASRNVVDLVDAPQTTRKAMNTLDAAGGRALLTAALTDRYSALYVLAITTGMRRGELLALKWEDVDLDRSVLSVKATLSQVKGGLRFGDPKTARSRRQIELGGLAVASLRERREAAEAEGHAKAGDVVFCTGNGTPITPANFWRDSWDPLRERAGMPEGFRFHDLRHTAATFMLAQGIHPKVASERLGHGNVSITLDTYSHVTKTMGRQAADAVDDLLSKPESAAAS